MPSSLHLTLARGHGSLHLKRHQGQLAARCTGNSGIYSRGWAPLSSAQSLNRACWREEVPSPKGGGARIRTNEKALEMHEGLFGLPGMSEHAPHPGPPRFSSHLPRWGKAFAKEQWTFSAFQSVLDEERRQGGRGQIPRKGEGSGFGSLVGWGWRNSEKAEGDTEAYKLGILIPGGRVAVLRGRPSLMHPRQ